MVTASHKGRNGGRGGHSQSRSRPGSRPGSSEPPAIGRCTQRCSYGPMVSPGSRRTITLAGSRLPLPPLSCRPDYDYGLRHSSIARALLRSVPIKIVADWHDTSVAMIERH